MSFYDLNKVEADEVTPAYVRKVALAKTMSLAPIEVNRGTVTQPHTHTNEEVVVVLEGASRFSLPNGEIDYDREEPLPMKTVAASSPSKATSGRFNYNHITDHDFSRSKG